MPIITDKIPEIAKLQQGCTAPKAIEPKDIESTAPSILKSMGTTKCSTSSTYSEDAFGTTGLASAVVGVQGQSKSNSVETVGCEQIAIQTAYYLSLKNSIICITNSTINNTSVSQKTINSIRFERIGELNINCSKFELDQSINVRAITSIKYSTEETTQIADLLKAYVDNTIELAAKSEQGLGGTPAGQKIIRDIKEVNNSNTYINKISQFKSNTKISYTQANEMVFADIGVVNLTADQCTLKQTNIVDIITTLLIDNTLSDIFKTITEGTSKSDYKAQLAQKSEGIKQGFGGNLVRNIIIIIVVVVLIYIGYKFLMGSSQK